MNENNLKEKFQIVDEHWQAFEDISQNESYKSLRAHAKVSIKLV